MTSSVAGSGPCVFIVLSTYGGAAYLQAQLQSLLAQNYTNWVLYWRDDGSTDETVSILAEFSANAAPGRCVRVSLPEGRLGPTASFMAVLRAVVPAMDVNDLTAFADQDDIWLPDKLTRGVRELVAANSGVPALYCARLAVVDAELHHLQETTMSRNGCGFPASLTQNIATGCTVMLNWRAATLVAGSAFPAVTLHDWWSYLLVTAAGGQVITDEAVVALYRQHGGNFIGIPRSQTRRAVAALRRGPAKFMHVLRQHVTALLAQPDLVCEAHYSTLLQVAGGLQGNLRQKLKALSLPGLHRQTLLETLLFRTWFLIG